MIRYHQSTKVGPAKPKVIDIDSCGNPQVSEVKGVRCITAKFVLSDTDLPCGLLVYMTITNAISSYFSDKRQIGITGQPINVEIPLAEIDPEIERQPRNMRITISAVGEPNRILAIRKDIKLKKTSGLPTAADPNLPRAFEVSYNIARNGEPVLVYNSSVWPTTKDADFRLKAVVSAVERILLDMEPTKVGIDSWEGTYLSLGRSLMKGVEYPKDAEEYKEWVAGVVECLCTDNNLLKNFLPDIEDEETNA